MPYSYCIRSWKHLGKMWSKLWHRWDCLPLDPDVPPFVPIFGHIFSFQASWYGCLLSWQKQKHYLRELVFKSFFHVQSASCDCLIWGRRPGSFKQMIFAVLTQIEGTYWFGSILKIRVRLVAIEFIVLLLNLLWGRDLEGPQFWDTTRFYISNIILFLLGLEVLIAWRNEGMEIFPADQIYPIRTCEITHQHGYDDQPTNQLYHKGGHHPCCPPGGWKTHLNKPLEPTTKSSVEVPRSRSQVGLGGQFSWLLGLGGFDGDVKTQNEMNDRWIIVWIIYTP